MSEIQDLLLQKPVDVPKMVKAFYQKLKKETGLTLELIKPEEEARLAVISCAPFDPNFSHVLIVDIGGGSTELVWMDLSEVPKEKRIAEMLKLQLGFKNKITQNLKNLKKII